MASYSSETSQDNRGRSGSSRALSAILPSSTSDIVIREMMQAFADATLPSGTDVGLVRLQYLKDSVWSKYADPLPGEEHFPASVREIRAIEKWQAAELRNASTNCRLTDGSSTVFTTRRVNGRRTRAIASGEVIDVARGIIKSVIGLKPPHASAVQGLFTNGASTRIKRTETAVADKFEGRPHITAQAALCWSENAFANPGWQRLCPDGHMPEVVEGSVMFTVPKNAKIDRVACKEPEANAYLQRAYGIFIRTRLKKHGIDLLDQTRNQYLSRVAQARGLATVDLSSASDTISRELVRKLLSCEWFDMLDSIRSKYVSVPNSEFKHCLEMFSSMGNGFTFELESLIFWALTRAISRLIGAKGTISVYGDDIICPTPTAKLLVRIFAYFGFSVNRSKSCISGGFRESCGAHWYFGYDVKPFFVRKRPQTISDLIQIANQLMAWLSTEEYSGDRPTSLLYLWGFLASLIRSDLYGGQSLQRVDALVTGHAPRRLLRRKTERVVMPQLGAYLVWHHSKLLAATVAVSPSDTRRELGWVLRPNRSWYDRDVMWPVQQVILDSLSRIA